MSSRYSNVSTIYLTSKEFWDWRITTESSPQIDLGEINNNTIFEVRSDTSFFLPAIFTRNLTFKFLGVGGIWQVVPTGGRQIFFGRMNTSGRIKATTSSDSVEMISLRNGDWKISGSIGNIEIADTFVSE